MNILECSALELGKRIKDREISVKEAVLACLAQARASESVLHAYITIDGKQAILQADRVQKKIDAGQLHSPLAGVPVAIKDNICTEGMTTTCGSNMLKGSVPTYSAQAVSNLFDAGAVLLGKTNMDEFAMGSTTETSAYGVTRNPRNMKHVPGGSSGGSCAAVASDSCAYALGSDTGGSIRQPASYCGVTGLKPTYGTVSRYGLIAYASSMDQIGPIAKNVSDCAAVLETIASYDSKDSTSIRRDNYQFTKALSADVRGMKIGIPTDCIRGDGNEEVSQAVQKAAQVLKKLGACVEEFDLELAEYAVPAYYTIASAEASSNLARFDGVKYGFRAQEYEGMHDMYKKTRSEGFGEEAKRRIMLGSFVLSSGYYDAYYLKALKVKALIKKEFDRVFEKYDVLLGPTAPTTAPLLGESLQNSLQMYRGDVYTVAANLCGLPAISIPCGLDSKGLPIGLQLTGNSFCENTILRAAYSYEQTGCFEEICTNARKNVKDDNRWQNNTRQ